MKILAVRNSGPRVTKKEPEIEKYNIGKYYNKAPPKAMKNKYKASMC
jgi:hypothetical protein